MKTVVVSVTLCYPDDKSDIDTIREVENYVQNLLGNPDPRGWVMDMEASEIYPGWTDERR